MNTRSINAPILRPVPLPHETYPFNLHSMLAPGTLLMIDFDWPTLNTAGLNEPATHPPCRTLRIVHPSLDGSITVGASSIANAVTVGDVLSAIHHTLSLPLNTASIPSIRRADVISYYQNYLLHHPQNRTLRRVHLLEGATLFAGLVMHVAEGNRIVGGIDGMQSLTWILQTRENSSYFTTTSYAPSYPPSSQYSYPQVTRSDDGAVIPHQAGYAGFGFQSGSPYW
jgi:hypothetical protein